MTDPNRMFVVCTDRGQHDEERLTWVRWHEEDHWSMPIGAGRSSVGYMWPSPDAERTLPGTRATGTPRSSYAFYCPVSTGTRKCTRRRGVRLFESFAVWARRA